MGYHRTSKSRKPNILTSLELKPEVMEERNIELQKKYAEIREKEVRYEMQQCEDADYVIVAFGSAARIAEKSIETAREQGIKVGLFRPITLGLSLRRRSLSWRRPRRASLWLRSMPVRWWRMYAWLSTGRHLWSTSVAWVASCQSQRKSLKH